MIRIKDHAKNRRLAAFIKHHKKENKDSDPVALRAEWEDAVPEHLTIKYQRIDSQWDAGNADHRSNLAHLVQTWLNDEKIGQRELETRLRFVHIAAPPTTSHVEGNSMEGKTGYLAAVTAERTMTAVEEQLTTEQARLRAICLEPAADRLTPRPMTEDEEAALLALFKHEFEVPAPPPFLLETMTSDEYARFEDNFLAIEYSLYAHLAPGPEAAEAQRIEVATFKKDLSRVSLDMRRRLIEVTFKGKSTAAKWAGWRMPLASRMVTLIDYESQREEALTTNALIRMDYYEFTVTVRSGAWTSTAIHRLFTTHFGMTIQKQNRTPSDAFGLSDRQWTLWVKFDTLPTNFRRLTYVTNDGKELLIHHNTVYANWPCKTCLEPDHPTRVCSLPKEKAEQCRRLHTKTITEAAPDCDGKASTGVKLPQTIDQLRRMLHLSSRRTNRKRDTSPKRTSTHKNKEGPSLPDSLKQYRSMTVPAEHQGEGCDTGRESNENPRERQDSQTNAEHTFKEERTPDARPKVDRSDHHDNGMEVDDDFNNPSSVAIPSISSQYIMSSAEQAGFAPAPTRPQEGAESTGSYGAPEASHNVHSTERQRVSPTRGRSPTRKTVGTGNPIVRGKTTLKQKVAKEVTKLLKRQTTEAKTKHHASTPKCRSASPKRKRAAQDTTVMESDVADRAGKWSKLSSKARSLSPTRRVEPTRGTAEDGTNGKNRLQSYMHSFLKTQDGLTESLSKVHTDSARPAESQTAPGHNLPEAPLTTTDPVACAAEEHLTDQGEVRVTEVRAATDPGAPVQEFLQVVSGTLVDVAANGHCGWLAFLAALNNTRHDLVNLSATVSKECNDTRKNVLNGILADLIDEMEVRPTEVEAQYTLSGYGSHINVPRPELLTSVMDHYIAQRKANVHTTVPRTMWVGPAQLKAMAIHARQPVFVLQVEREGNTRVQMYAYANYMLPNKKTKRKNKTKQGPKTPTKEQTSLTELGTVTMVPTDTAKLLLQELVDNGLLPLILVLQDQHFKAVVYDETRFQEYCALRKQLNQVRNAILKNYFGLEMDVIPFDTDRQAKAAQSSIRKIRGELLKFRASAEAKTTASRSEPVQKVSSPQPTADSSPSTPPPTLVSSGVAEAYTPTSAPQTTEREICKKMHTTIPVPNAGRPWSPPPTPDPGNHGMKDPGAQ
ncbi:hypothetical protein PHPALM_489 [Phytophthora palmivora]|uniref:Uncharacterized protein n=1 Tax=Phytophthora palmivora TaxID=4796 RepID=A0A2P4YUQ5_9STRA|nr:hypothetical protein PHPALM_489 [Phytophthora palmivora]